MNEKGFTLIELLIVIVIVAVVGITSAVIFNNINKSTTEESLTNTYISIQQSGKLYVDLNDSRSKSFCESGEETVSISELFSTKYIDKKLYNAYKKERGNSNDADTDIFKMCIATDPETNNKYVNTCIIRNDSGNVVCVSDNEGNTNISECCTHCDEEETE